MLEEICKLSVYIDAINDKWGGDIELRSPVSDLELNAVEMVLNHRLPEIFRWLYTKKTNGVQIDNGCVLGIYDSRNKKTFVENVNRYNDPSKNLYFKGRPNIFDDYIIVGYHNKNLICVSKKYDFPNPLLYSCADPNNTEGVNFYCMDLDLRGFIRKMIFEVFEDDEEYGDLVLK